MTKILTASIFRTNTEDEYIMGETSECSYGDEWNGNVRGYVLNSAEDAELTESALAREYVGAIHGLSTGALVWVNEDGVPVQCWWAEEEPDLQIVNLTPHEIRIGDVRIPSAGLARCATVAVPLYVRGCPVPVVRQRFGEVTGLPDPEEGVIYVVSMPVAQAVGRDRDDIFVPGEQIRDEQGRIIGCKSLARL